MDQFGLLLRDIVRDAVRTELRAAPPMAAAPPADRIGGIKLAVEVTGKARQTIYNLVAQREIPHSKPKGVGLVFCEKDLREWMLTNQRPMAGDAARNAHQFIVQPRRKGVKR